MVDKRYTFRQIEFWAENGLVRLRDADKAAMTEVPTEEFYKVLPPGDFFRRITAIYVQSLENQYWDERAEIAKLFGEGVEVVKAAKKQGDPTDGRVLEHLSKHQRRQRISMASSRLPPLAGIGYKFKQQDHRETLWGGEKIEADFSTPPSAWLPPTKTKK